jgi:hypothetical protein
MSVMCALTDVKQDTLEIVNEAPAAVATFDKRRHIYRKGEIDSRARFFAIKNLGVKDEAHQRKVEDLGVTPLSIRPSGVRQRMKQTAGSETRCV